MEEALGKKCCEVFGDKDLACKEVCPVETVIVQKLHILHHEGKLKTRSGDVKDMRVSISPFYNGETIIGAVVVIEDITRLKEVEQTNVKIMITLEKEIEERIRAEEALVKEKVNLQEALAKLKTLRGMLPICASCKKIRDDKGYWKRIEAYIMEHSEAEFSHSI